MEENNITPKKNTGLVVTLVISIIVIIGLIGYICYDKQLISIGNKKTESQINIQKDKKADKNNSSVTTDDEDKSIKDEDTQNTTVTKLKSYAYATEDDKYVLILNEYNRNVLNPKVGGESDNRFILSEDDYYGSSSVSGSYHIEGDKLTLYILIDDFNRLNNMLNELGVNVITDQGNCSVSLPLTNNTVVIGNIILYLK